MALKLHCIFNQPAALSEVIKLVEKTAHKLNSQNKRARVEDVYNELRDQQFEIDAESVAFAYENVGGIMGRKNFSSQADVRRFGGASMKRAIEIANKGGLEKQKLGRQSISNSVAIGIANTFSVLNGRNDVDASKLYKIQEAVKKAASSMLDKKGFKNKNPKASFKEVLQQAFSVEDVSEAGKEGMKGRIKSKFNDISDIWEAVKSDISTVSKGIKDKAERAKFDQMTEAIMNSSYDLLLSTPQADGVVKDILKKAGYTKTINAGTGSKVVIDWNKAIANQNDWRSAFSNVLQSEGFDPAQSGRIMSRLEDNYKRVISKQAENKLNAINKKNGIKKPVNKEAVNRMINLGNAGIFSPNNKQHLRDAMGVDIPQDISDQIRQIVKDYENNISKTGNISNVEAEEVVRAIRNLLSPLDSKGADKVMNALSDYLALRASSTISTIFNAAQNITSGINSSILSTITAVARTKNPKVIWNLMKGWVRAFADVSAGGVTIRDARTVNALEQLQGRGGLSDRWTFDNANGFWGYTKAALNTLGQITATAADAANGTVIYHAGIITAAKQVLQSRGKSAKEANRIIDDIMFGTDKATGKTNRQLWYEEAKNRLANQEGVIDRNSKAKRIADELVWNKLVTDYGVSIDEVKAIQSASLEQKSKNLGHESDVLVSPSSILNAINHEFQRKSEEAKKAENRGPYHLWQAAGHVFRAVNMFVGGKANWAILSLQNSPVGIAFGLVDVAIKEASAIGRDQAPLYRQKLVEGDATKLREQLAERKAVQARFERGVYGSMIQYILYAGVMAMADAGGDDDEDRKKKLNRVFGPKMNDPNTRRLLDKALPMMLASELTYAYDRKTGKLDKKKLSNSFWLPQYDKSLSAFAENISDQVVGTTAIDRLSESLGYADKIKNTQQRKETKSELISMYVGGLLQLPYTSWYNVEKNEMKVFSNGFNPDPTELARQRAAWKKSTKSTSGIAEAFIKGLVTQQIYAELGGDDDNKK